jgi:hypothetical protein
MGSRHLRSNRPARTTCGWHRLTEVSQLGNLTLADLIVVAANPLDDITNVRRLQLVLKEGRVVSDKRHLSGAIPQPE